MGLLGIVGGMRKGKTLLMVILGHHVYKIPRKVYMNLKLNFSLKGIPPKYRPKRFSLYELVNFMEEPSEKWSKMMLGWDEIYINLECRLSASSELNRIASYFVFQCGKRDVDIVWTSQRFGNPDNRLRWATIEVGRLAKALGVIVRCPEKSYKRIDSTHCWQSDCKHFKYCSENQDFILKYAFWNGRKWKKRSIHNVQKYFGMYDTAKVIDYNETLRVREFLRLKALERKKKMKEYFKEFYKKGLSEGTTIDNFDIDNWFNNMPSDVGSF